MQDSIYQLETYPHATPFLSIMREHLEASEARNGLMLGLALRVEEDPTYYGDGAPYFATVTENVNGEVGNVIAAALMTPPHGPVLFCDHEDAKRALMAIAQNLYATRGNVPTVNGPSAVALQFAEMWSELAGISYALELETRAFELTQVIPPRPCAGQLRLVLQSDFELALRWFREFGREALNDTNEERLHKQLKTKMKEAHLFFWENGEPVSMAGLTRPTERGIAIGPVYTPPEQRGRGYASAAVAALSQQMLESGKEFCMLFTDLANPTSNSIYQKIGYRPVGDFSVYRFGS